MDWVGYGVCRLKPWWSNKCLLSGYVCYNMILIFVIVHLGNRFERIMIGSKGQSFTTSVSNLFCSFHTHKCCWDRFLAVHACSVCFKLLNSSNGDSCVCLFVITWWFKFCDDVLQVFDFFYYCATWCKWQVFLPIKIWTTSLFICFSWACIRPSPIKSLMLCLFHPL